ncbi:response regulator transcription factor [Brevundimonas sp. S30B]|uniref:response regulator n=1 Tax=unclassified Brevundimonas TaxID=2622653 RepID=UPI001072E5DB|nr:MULTISPECIES: response regulator transcription factor [unclassified Brevundimonas]QBX38409.1 response regulator transcription factor [Brevundimonas sp. MF30-B]TFW02118.1 response regulator transcription factor [Brevundimonas sp. S30B]
MRVLIADDHELTRAGLRAVIDREPDLEVIDEAATGEAAVDRCAAGDVDVAILDIRFGSGMTGLEAARRILEHAGTRVLLLTLHDTAEYVRSALAAGVTGYVLKDAGREELLHAIRAVGEGRTALPSALLRLAVSPVAGPSDSDLARLTPREREVLALIKGGLTNKAIARELGIRPGTVKVHVEKVIAKLGVTDRTQAAVFAARILP